MTRDKMAIAKKIFDFLGKNGTKHASEVANGTGLHHNTIKSYAGLIQYIQSQPTLVFEETKHAVLLKLEKKED